MKIVNAIDARLQFIEAAATSDGFSKASGVEEVFLHTGRHYDQAMSDIFFEEFGVAVSKYNLDIGSGVQQGDFFGRVPCFALRDETEWVELVEAGWSRLVSPTDVDVLVRVALKIIGTQGSDNALYGDGNSCEAIVKVLVQ